jgi:hypothetical protein
MAGGNQTTRRMLIPLDRNQRFRICRPDPAMISPPLI